MKFQVSNLRLNQRPSSCNQSSVMQRFEHKSSASGLMADDLLPPVDGHILHPLFTILHRSMPSPLQQIIPLII